MTGQFLETDIRPVLQVEQDRYRWEFQNIFSQLVERARGEELPLKVARPEQLMTRHEGMHYHFKPEIFYQIEGFTEFHFPTEKMTLAPGDFGIVPRGVPHGERIWTEGPAFRNVVVGFYSHTISCHFAGEASPGRPDITAIEFYPTPHFDHIVDLLELLIQFHFQAGSTRRTAVTGLLTAFLAVMQDLLEKPVPPEERDSRKIFQAKWIIREQLYNPKLNVKHLAQRLRCSADYLSNIFRKETGETLIHYINRQRVNGAKNALGSTNLSVSEIAWATGFSDPGYFTRVFKRFTGHTPGNYREMLQGRQRGSESIPKTIYYDREEYSSGKPVIAKGADVGTR